MTLGRVEPNDDLSAAPDISGSYQYYTGWLQGFGVYGFPFSPAQALAHANAALTPASVSRCCNPLPRRNAAEYSQHRRRYYALPGVQLDLSNLREEVQRRTILWRLSGDTGR